MKPLNRGFITHIYFYFILMSQPTDGSSEFHIRQMTFGSQLCITNNIWYSTNSILDLHFFLFHTYSYTNDLILNNNFLSFSENITDNLNNKLLSAVFKRLQNKKYTLLFNTSTKCMIKRNDCLYLFYTILCQCQTGIKQRLLSGKHFKISR